MKTSPFLMAAMILLPAFCVPSFCLAQNRSLLTSDKLINFSKTLIPLNAGGKQGVTCDGIAWLKDTHFSSGTIEVDLRGKDVVQKSFLGIVFHGVDTTTYDIIYFRPFNFRTTDSVRRIHAVQYCSAPDYPWDRLRAERNGQFEKGIQPPPDPEQWFHARIEVHGKEVSVYVNGARYSSLTVQKLNDRKDGLIGIWSSSYGVTGDFANLVITPENISRP
ncbi:MAG TPA: hypothetical protein VE035_08445 [Puia sp.]|nr:hypothetical protein [Puia sp.]